jgi:hypothetical protein
MSQLFYLPFRPVFNSRGLPIGGAKIYFYKSGTSSLATVYADGALTTPLTNPVLADGMGQLPDIYMPEDVTYRVRIVDRNGGGLGSDIDPYIPGQAVVVTPSLPQLIAPGGSALVGYQADGLGAAARTVQDELRDTVSAKQFGAKGDNSNDDYAAIMAAINSLDVSGGRGGIVYFPKGGYRISQTINVPPRIRLLADAPRDVAITAAFNGVMVSFDSVTHSGISGMRLGMGTGAASVAIDIKALSSSIEQLHFSDLEIAGGAVPGQIGIRLQATSSGIITKSTFHSINFFQVDKGVYDRDSEGNFWSAISIDQFGYAAVAGFDAQGLANFYQVRVSGAPAAGSVGFKNTGARCHADLIVDIGPTSVALDLAPNGYNIVRIARPEGLTPLGPVGTHNRILDADLGLSSPIRPSSPTGIVNTGVLYGGSGAPGNAAGANGDFYFRSDAPATPNQRLYMKASGSWVGIL